MQLGAAHCGWLGCRLGVRRQALLRALLLPLCAQDVLYCTDARACHQRAFCDAQHDLIYISSAEESSTAEALPAQPLLCA